MCFMVLCGDRIGRNSVWTLYLAGKVSFWLQFALETFWCYQLLAGKCLKDESRKVYVLARKPQSGGGKTCGIDDRGRDTGNLSGGRSDKGSDGRNGSRKYIGRSDRTAHFYVDRWGTHFGFFYKAVNTMDSMVGYKNEKYLHFGRFAAKMDDVWNYIPSRISALLMIASAWIFRMDYKGH